MQENRNNRHRHNNRSHNRDGNNLPSSEILEKFEDAVPGSVEKIIQMAEKEQTHRHAWQDKYIKSHNLTYRLGQICGLAYNAGLLYLVYDLVQSGEQTLALKLFLINAGIIAFAIIATATERKIFSRRPLNKRRDGNHRRNNKQHSDQNRRRPAAKSN